MGRGLLGRAVLVLASTAGAGCFESPGPALPCGPATACPPALTCVAGLCQAAGGDASAGPGDASVIDAGSSQGPDGARADRDNDGIFDDVDLCPEVADPGQFDEDGDQLGDRCDPCPYRAGPAGNVDSDNDGVGDACDPGPEPHEWAYFTGFAVDDGLWTRSGGAWAIGGGALTQSQATTTPTSATLPANLFGGPGATLSVGGRVTAVGGTGRYLWLSVGEQMVAGGPSYVTCTHNHPTSGAPEVAIEHLVSSNYNVLTSVPTQPLEPGGFELVAQSEPGSVVRCTVALASGGRPSLSTVAPQPLAGPRGIYVEDLAIAVDWAAVVRRR